MNGGSFVVAEKAASVDGHKRGKTERGEEEGRKKKERSTKQNQVSAICPIVPSDPPNSATFCITFLVLLLLPVVHGRHDTFVHVPRDIRVETARIQQLKSNVTLFQMGHQPTVVAAEREKNDKQRKTTKNNEKQRKNISTVEPSTFCPVPQSVAVPHRGPRQCTGRVGRDTAAAAAAAAAVLAVFDHLFHDPGPNGLGLFGTGAAVFLFGVDGVDLFVHPLKEGHRRRRVPGFPFLLFQSHVAALRGQYRVRVAREQRERTEKRENREKREESERGISQWHCELPLRARRSSLPFGPQDRQGVLRQQVGVVAVGVDDLFRTCRERAEREREVERAERSREKSREHREQRQSRGV